MQTDLNVNQKIIDLIRTSNIIHLNSILNNKIKLTIENLLLYRTKKATI